MRTGLISRMEPRRSLEDQSYLGMLLTAVSATWLERAMRTGCKRRQIGIRSPPDFYGIHFRKRRAVSVTAKAGDPVFIRIEHVTLAGGKASQFGVAGAVIAKAGTAGFAGNVQRLDPDSPVRGFRPGFDQRQALPQRLEKTEVAVTFQRSAIDRQ